MRIVALRRAAIVWLAGAMAACGVSESPAEPLPPIAAERFVEIGAAPRTPLTEEFVRVAELANPCGDFPPNLTFGADADLLRVSCLPDPRNAESDGFNGMRGYLHPPPGAPWRVAIDLATGAELARLSIYTTCSSEFDRLELALGRGRTIYHCKLDREDSGDGWRAVSNRSSERPFGLTIPYTHEYRFVAVGDAIVRQAGRGTAAEGIPNPEVSFPFRDGDFIWRPLPLSDDGSIDCATATNASIDGRRILLMAGRRGRQQEANGYAFSRCDDIGAMAVDPGSGESVLLPTSAFGNLRSTGEGLVSRDRGGGWRTDDVLFHVVRPDSSISVGFLPGEALGLDRVRRLQPRAGEQLIVMEATPRMHFGERRFDYVVFDWTGRVLARFEAQSVAPSPDRARLIVSVGDRLQVWDLRP